MSTTDRRDVIGVLAGDHRAVEEICRQLETGHGGLGSSRKSLVDTLALELAWHCAAAQRFLVPLARRALPDGEALADEHTAEHLTVEHMVRDLEAKDPSDPRFELLLAQLVAAARGHIEHEERITFAELTRLSDPGELLAAGEQLTEVRLRAADGVVPAAAGQRAGLTGFPAQPRPHGQHNQHGQPIQAAPAAWAAPAHPATADHHPETTGHPGPPSASALAAAAQAQSVVDRVRAVFADS